MINEFIKIPIKKNNKDPPLIGYKNIKCSADVKHNFKNCNVAYLTGKLSGITVIDVDLYKKGCNDIWNDLIKENGDINTLTTKTPSGGLHYYFKYNAAVHQTQNHKDNIDIRSDGGYIMSPPSSINGNAYKYINDSEPADMPEWLLNYLIARNGNKQTNKDITINEDSKNTGNDVNNDGVFYPCSEKVITRMLNYLPPDYYNDTKKWFNITNILKKYNMFDVWDNWSKNGDKYNYKQNLKTWDYPKHYNININYLVNICNKIIHAESRENGDSEHEKNEYYFKNKFNLINGTINYKPINKDHHIKTIIQNDDYNYDNKDEEYIKKRFVNIDNETFNNYKTILIKSDTGTGKTYATAEYLRKHKGKKILSIVSRSSLASQHVHSFNKAGVIIHDYNNVKNINDVNNLAVCLDSIIKLECEPEELYNGVLVLDEVHSIINYLTDSSTLNDKRISIYSKLIQIIKNVGFIIAMDADLSDVVFDFIKPFRDIKDCVFINNVYNNYTKIKAYKHNNYTFDNDKIISGMIELMKNDINTGKFFTACFTSLSLASNIHAQITKLYKHRAPEDFILITSKDGPKILNDVNEDWQGKYVFYSPKIIYGIDFTPDIPQNVYIFNSISTINPLQIAQQMTRNRNIKTVHYWFSREDKQITPLLYKNEDELKNYITQYIKDFENKLNAFRGTRLINGDVMIDNENEFLKLFFTNEFNDHIFMTNPLYHFEEILKNKGFDIIDYTDEPTHKYNLKTIETARKEKDKKRTRDAIKLYCDSNKDLDINYSLFDENIFKKMDYLKLTEKLFEEEETKYKNFIVKTMADDREFEKHLICSQFLKITNNLINKCDNKNEYVQRRIKHNNNKLLTIVKLENILNIDSFDIDTLKHENKFNDIINYPDQDYNEYKKCFNIRNKSTKPGTWGGCYNILIGCYNKILDDENIISVKIKRDANRKRIYYYKVNPLIINYHCRLLILRQRVNLNYPLINKYYECQEPTINTYKFNNDILEHGINAPHDPPPSAINIIHSTTNKKMITDLINDILDKVCNNITYNINNVENENIINDAVDNNDNFLKLFSEYKEKNKPNNAPKLTNINITTSKYSGEDLINTYFNRHILLHKFCENHNIDNYEKNIKIHQQKIYNISKILIEDDDYDEIKIKNKKKKQCKKCDIINNKICGPCKRKNNYCKCEDTKYKLSDKKYKCMECKKQAKSKAHAIKCNDKKINVI